MRAPARFVVVSSVVAVATAAMSGVGWAATPSVPTALAVQDQETQRPWLAATVSDPDGGTVSGKFFARTVGSSTWNLVNGSSVSVTSGSQATLQLPTSPVLAIGQGFEWQVQACDSTACSALTALQTGYVSPALGAGSRRSATQIPFDVGDRVGARVDAGSGNLLVTTEDLAVPGIGQDVQLGVSYNSLATAPGSRYPTGASNSLGAGWSWRGGWDLALKTNPDGSVVLLGADGATSTFTAPTGTAPVTYTSPAEVHADLKKVNTSTADTWELTDHASSTTAVFDSSGRLTSSKDRNGNTTSYAYSAGAPTSVTGTRGTTAARTVTVGVSGLTTTVSQAAVSGYPRKVQYTRDSLGNLVSIIDAAGRTTSFGYDASGRLSSITNTGGNVTTFAYDASNRVTSVTRQNSAAPGNATTRFTYPSASSRLVADPNTDQASAVSAVPHTTYTLTPDGTERVSSAVDPDGYSHGATYTTKQDVASSTVDAGGANPGTTTLGHTANAGESLTSVAAPTGDTTTLTYTNTGKAAFQPSTIKDSASRTTQLGYDSTGNQTSTADNAAAQSTVTRNSDGTVATASDPLNTGNPTTFTYGGTYESAGSLTSMTAPTGSTIGARTFTYDAYGRVATDVQGGATRTYGYDNLDRVTQVSFSCAADAVVTCPGPVSWTYTTAGQVKTRTDDNGTTTWTYDDAGHLTSRVNTAGGDTFSWAYDRNGNVTGSTDARGTVTYTYNNRNLLDTWTTIDKRLIRYAYDGAGRRTDTWFNADAAVPPTTWAAHSHATYDASGRVSQSWTSTNSSDATANRIFDTTYCRASNSTAPSCSTAATDDRSQLQWIRDNLTGNVTTYTYDTAGRLAGVAVAGGKTYTYSYDKNGNRTSAADGTTTQNLTYNAGNQITSTGYSHDSIGNLTKDPSNTSVKYDAAGQMTAVTKSSGGTGSYRYAGVGNDELISQTLTDGSTVGFAYGRDDANGQPLIHEVTVGTTAPAYVDHDPNGVPQVLDTTTSTEIFYILDGMGSPVALVKYDGTVSGSYSYDPYGTYTDTNKSGGTATATNPYRFKLPGLYDRTTGWIKYGQRWYNPTTGRFTQQDAILHLLDPTQANRYAYAGDDPINDSDPTGASVWSSIAGAVGFVGACITGAGAVTGAVNGSGIGPAVTALTGVGGVALEAATVTYGCFGGTFAAGASLPFIS